MRVSQNLKCKEDIEIEGYRFLTNILEINHYDIIYSDLDLLLKVIKLNEYPQGGLSYPAYIALVKEEYAEFLTYFFIYYIFNKQIKTNLPLYIPREKLNGIIEIWIDFSFKTKIINEPLIRNSPIFTIKHKDLKSIFLEKKELIRTPKEEFEKLKYL